MRATTAAILAAVVVSAVAGGLLRAGVPLPVGGAWLSQAMLWHGALMVAGVFGTVIGLERAVAAKHAAAFVAPLASALGALALLAGAEATGRAGLAIGAVVFVVVNLALVRRQAAPHTRVLLLAAVAGAIGTGSFASGDGTPATIAWWFAFLVLTIAAERLEMTRLMRHRPAAMPSFCAAVVLLLAGAIDGGVLFGLALASLGVWLLVFDIARRTLAAQGLSRYMALCLLAGHAWLVVAGLAWAATALGLPARDAALHALGLGFVFSMVMGHAPVILPALTRLKVRFGPAFHAAPALLHASLVLRLGVGAFDPAWRARGALLGAVALGLFVVTLVTHIGVPRPRAAFTRPARSR